MSLVKCPECQSEISDKATSCPKCGYPLKKQNVTIDKVRNIELTSKKWKTQKLIFWPILIIGFPVFWFSLINYLLMDQSKVGLIGLIIGGLMLFVGFIGVVKASFGAWWQHR